MRPPESEPPAPPADGIAVVAFWRKTGPKLWFARDPDFDRRFRECFLALHQAAARGDLANWPETPDGALGLVLLLDQYPRNAFRDTPRMYEPDPMALAIASAAVGAGHDRALDDTMAMFLYLPFGHAENGVDQEMSVSLVRRLGPDVLSNAERHGKHHPLLRARFPHRNAILGWNTTRCERRFLPQGGFTG